MIQRIQSVFLLLAAICFGLEFITPFATTDAPASGLFNDQMYNIWDHVVLLILTITGTLLCLGLIFLYKNRPLQLRFGYLAITIGILLPVISILIYSNHVDRLDGIQVSDQLGLYLPIGMIGFTALAIMYIKKDDKLVKSMDRLR